MKKARVIYNPTSGKELIKKNLADILSILEECGYEASAFATTPEENSARNEAHRAARAGFDLLVAAGGDGTINEVVNGIAPLKRRPKMAIIPAGTTNDYARALKIPRDNIVKAHPVTLEGGEYVMFTYEGLGTGLQEFILTVYGTCMPMLNLTRRKGLDIERFFPEDENRNQEPPIQLRCEYLIPIRR